MRIKHHNPGGTMWRNACLLWMVLRVAACTSPGHGLASPDGSVKDAAPPCRPDGYQCSTDNQCCGGTCLSTVCTTGPLCISRGASCTRNATCCSDNCVNNICVDTLCLPATSGCTVDTECCSGVCNVGNCS